MGGSRARAQAGFRARRLHRREGKAAVGVGHDALVTHALRELGEARQCSLPSANLAAEGGEGCNLRLGLAHRGGLHQLREHVDAVLDPTVERLRLLGVVHLVSK